MLSIQSITLTKNIVSKSFDEENVGQEIKETLIGTRFNNIGLIEDIKIMGIGLPLVPISIKRNKFLQISTLANYYIFNIPNGFILPNAEFQEKRVNESSNNETYIFRVTLKNIEGEIFNCLKDNDILCTVTNMGKSEDVIKKLKHLTKNEKVNLVCLKEIKKKIVKNGKDKILLNCNLLNYETPINFAGNSNIDVDKINEMRIKDETKKFHLFEKHQLKNGKLANKLVDGKMYTLTIYGIMESNEDGIDFITNDMTETIPTSNNYVDTIIGFNTLNDYLYHKMYNWICCTF